MTETQAVPWERPRGPLGELTAASEARVERLLARGGELERAALKAMPAPSLVAALAGRDVAVIAEIKRRSPSRGVLDDALDAPLRAATYVAGGAAALSVLTEPTRFGGSLDDLRAVHRVTSVPILRKDFIVDRVQLLETRAAGASAVLLIARALAPARFAALATEAAAMGLEVLLEVRSEAELERALAHDTAIIGINNRNLETLEVDEAVSARLLRHVPRGRIAVYESGVRDRAAVVRAALAGADAVLVGSALSTSADGAAAVAGLAHVPRHPRER